MARHRNPGAGSAGNSVDHQKASRSSDGPRNSKAHPTSKVEKSVIPGGSTEPLSPDREQVAAFITLFKHATAGMWVSLRAFPDKGNKSDKPFRITPYKLNGNFDTLIDKACHDIELAANNSKKIVFCPPIATFDKRYVAREQNLAEGLAISVECDKHAQAGRDKLKRLLGPATVVVESGGEWIDPETGEVQSRLHVHYRLKVPARNKEQLREALAPVWRELRTLGEKLDKGRG